MSDEVADLHAHMSGTTPPTALWEIIRESGYKTGIKTYLEFERHMSMDRDRIKDLDSYLRVLHSIDKAQSSPMAVEKSAYAAYRASFLAGCDHMELRWNCVKRSQGGRIDLDSLIIAARAGYERAKWIYGITGEMLLCLGRDCTLEENKAIFMKALQYHEKGVIGIDTAGPEGPLSTEYIGWYKEAHKKSMVTTCHVGETHHPGVEDEIAFVLEKLHPYRIGHGIQIVRYPHLLRLASSMKIIFELCPSSNLASRAVSSIKELKDVIKVLNEHSIQYRVCTDAMFPLKTDIKREMEMLA